MKKLEEIVVNGKKFFKTKLVKLDGVVYQELASADPMKPDFQYLDQTNGKLVSDHKTYIALREKYCLDKRRLYGDFVFDSGRFLEQTDWETELRSIPFFKDIEIEYVDKPVSFEKYSYSIQSCVIASGEHKGQVLSRRVIADDKTIENMGLERSRVFEDFFLEKGTETINEMYFESDVAEFSKNATNELGHILEKRGIENTQEWFEQKMRGESRYTYNPNISIDAAANCQAYGSGNINFSSMAAANTKTTRAHEMGHKIGMDGGTRTGLAIWAGQEVAGSTTIDGKTLYAENGSGLNEGMTQLLSEVLSGEPADYAYSKETEVARKVLELCGKDATFEGVLFEPVVLIQKFNEQTHEQGYFQLILALDNYQRINNKLTEHERDMRAVAGASIDAEDGIWEELIKRHEEMKSVKESMESARDSSLLEVNKTLMSAHTKSILSAKDGEQLYAEIKKFMKYCDEPNEHGHMRYSSTHQDKLASRQLLAEIIEEKGIEVAGNEEYKRWFMGEWGHDKEHAHLFGIKDEVEQEIGGGK